MLPFLEKHCIYLWLFRLVAKEVLTSVWVTNTQPYPSFSSLNVVAFAKRVLAEADASRRARREEGRSAGPLQGNPVGSL